jgi:hypothetical protein
VTGAAGTVGSAVGTYPATYAQESLWPPSGSSAINVPAAVRLPGQPDLGSLREVLAGLVERHGALRTVLGRAPDGSLQQCVAAAGFLDLDVTSHRGCLREGLAELLRDGSERPFRVDGGQLARAELHSFSGGDHVLIVWLHHAVCDLASAGVLAEEIGHLHAGAPLPPPGLQMSDYAARERAMLPGPRHQGYWPGVLGAADGRLGLPVPCGGEHRAVRPALPVLPAEVAASLAELAAAHRTTLAAVLATAAIAVHARAATAEQVMIGLTIGNRDLPQFRSAVGCLADQLPLVVNVAGAATFACLLDRVREGLLDAYDHRLPLGALLPWAWRQRPPVFAVNLNFVLPRRPGSARPAPLEFPYGIVKTRPDPWWLGDAVLAYRPRIDSRGLGGEIEGDATVHDPETVARYGRQFGELLARVARAPESEW